MSYFFCNFANIYIQTITKSNKMDINIFTPPACPRTLVWGISQRAESLSQLHLNPSKGI